MRSSRVPRRRRAPILRQAALRRGAKDPIGRIPTSPFGAHSEAARPSRVRNASVSLPVPLHRRRARSSQLPTLSPCFGPRFLALWNSGARDARAFFLCALISSMPARPNPSRVTTRRAPTQRPGARAANAADSCVAEGAAVQRVGGLGGVPGGGGEPRGPVPGRGFRDRLRALRTKSEVCACGVFSFRMYAGSGTRREA